MNARVLISCIHLQRTIDLYRKRFEAQAVDIDLPEISQQLGEADLLPIIDRYDGVIAGDDFFTAKVLEKAKRLKIVSKWGVGVDAIDRGAAEKLGIRVTNTPGVFGDEVADVTMGYIILLARKLHLMHQSVRENGWLKVKGSSLRGKTLGIVGFGDIGRAVAKRAHAHGMEVVASDVVTIHSGRLQETSAVQKPLDGMLKQADYVALCCNLTRDNVHMISTRQFGLMKRGVRIVNTARGPLIDEAALIAALESGVVAGAALDVFEEEPLPASSPLRKFENVIFGTHNGSNTEEAVLRVNEMSIENLFKGLREVRR